MLAEQSGGTAVMLRFAVAATILAAALAATPSYAVSSKEK